jgi:DNA-binding transcriptional MerR regulator
LYSEKVFPRIERIIKLKDEGRSLREIVSILNG